MLPICVTAVRTASLAQGHYRLGLGAIIRSFYRSSLAPLWVAESWRCAIGHLRKFTVRALAALFSCSVGYLYSINSLPPCENALRSSRKLNFRRCSIEILQQLICQCRQLIRLEFMHQGSNYIAQCTAFHNFIQFIER